MVVSSVPLVKGCNSEYRIYKRVKEITFICNWKKKSCSGLTGCTGLISKKMVTDITFEFKLFDPDFVLVEGIGKILL